jgi:hypothetical protein
VFGGLGSVMMSPIGWLWSSCCIDACMGSEFGTMSMGLLSFGLVIPGALVYCGSLVWGEVCRRSLGVMLNCILVWCVGPLHVQSVLVCR